MRNTIVNAAIYALCTLAAGSVLASPAHPQDATIMDCGSRHTPCALAGQPDMARSPSNIAFQIPGGKTTGAYLALVEPT